MKRTRHERLRLGWLYVAVCLVFAVIGARLVQLQVVKHAQYGDIVNQQSSGRVAIPAERGLIFDRNGVNVANNVTRASLYAHPLSPDELAQVSRYIGGLFNMSSSEVSREYGLKVGKFRWIERHISDVLAARIRSDRTVPTGLFLRQETRREYPQGLVGKQILGFTNIDNRGQAGLELAYDSLLAGKKGWADIRRDGLRNLYRVNEQSLVKPLPGKSLILTVDWRLQEILEEELRHGVDSFQATQAMGAFVDCRTGEVLAIAHFDPDEKHAHRPDKLRPVTDLFEPGSIFKAITAAGLLDAGQVDFAETTYCENGQWRVGRRTLHDDKELGWLTFREIIELSSNIGIAKYALNLGGDNLYETARQFGFGEKTNVGIGGEAGGSVYLPQRWSDYTVAALSFGHSISVTCLQMTMAMAAIANGGELLRPQLVLCAADEKGRVTRLWGREVVRRVMEEESVDSLQAFLRGVVERGTAKKAELPAVPLAGKTGTAELTRADGRGYHKNKFVASFAGFFPYEEPAVAGIIALWEPEPIHYGGHTAGPIFRNIVERYMVTNPDFLAVDNRTLTDQKQPSKHTVQVPDLTGRGITQARALADERGITLRGNADSGIVVWQYPAADRIVFHGNEVLVAVVSEAEQPPAMIDLHGLSVRQASAFLAFVGINGRVKGHGRVVDQSIPPGEVINKNEVCWLRCQPI